MKKADNLNRKKNRGAPAAKEKKNKGEGNS